MGTKIEALPIPLIRPGRKFWLVAGIVALLVTGSVAGMLALRSGSPEASVPAQRQLSRAGSPPAMTSSGPASIQVANSSGNLTSHGEAYFTAGAGAASEPRLLGRGARLAELHRRLAANRDVGLVTGTGPGLIEIAGKDQPGFAQCRMVRSGPC